MLYSLLVLITVCVVVLLVLQHRVYQAKIRHMREPLEGTPAICYNCAHVTARSGEFRCTRDHSFPNAQPTPPGEHCSRFSWVQEFPVRFNRGFTHYPTNRADLPKDDPEEGEIELAVGVTVEGGDALESSFVEAERKIREAEDRLRRKPAEALPLPADELPEGGIPFPLPVVDNRSRLFVFNGTNGKK